MQLVQRSPAVIVDVAHNHQSLSLLFENLITVHEFRQLILVIGIMKDKSIEAALELIKRYVDYAIVVQPAVERAMPYNEMLALFQQAGIAATGHSDVATGVEAAFKTAGPEDLIAVTGSHVTVGEFLWHHRGNKKS
jgi:dihydrofolate synthase/folylpolyglutamate synthase